MTGLFHIDFGFVNISGPPNKKYKAKTVNNVILAHPETVLNIDEELDTIDGFATRVTAMYGSIYASAKVIQQMIIRSVKIYLECR